MSINETPIQFRITNKSNDYSHCYLSFSNNVHKEIIKGKTNKDFNIEAISISPMNETFVFGKLTKKQSSFKTELIRLQNTCKDKERFKDFFSINIYNLSKDFETIYSKHNVGLSMSATQHQKTIVDIKKSTNMIRERENLYDFEKYPILKLSIPANMEVILTMF